MPRSPVSGVRWPRRAGARNRTFVRQPTEKNPCISSRLGRAVLNSSEADMNRPMWSWIAVVMVLCGCGWFRGPETKSAVREALEVHLKQRPNLLMANMTMEVQEVKFSGDRAEALVKYQSKQAAEVSVLVRYVLRKSGKSWEVESSSPAGGAPMVPHGPSSSRERSPRAPALEPSH